jgi:cytochrome o ubiquinol oxidase subunit 2
VTVRKAVRCLAQAGWLSVLALPGCKPAVLDPRGPVGAQDAQILIDSLVIMLVIIVPTLVAAASFAFWFRASNTRARFRPDFVHSGRIELLVWSIPLLVITLLGGVVWIGSHRLDPKQSLPGTPLVIQGVALDWKWLFIYPDQHIAAVNQISIPVGRPIRFSLTSASVMNAFFIARLGSMIYTMNGMATTLNLQAAQPGQYLGISSHFSGDGFSDMHFTVDAVPQDKFDAWVAGARGGGKVLDAAAYNALARQSEHVPAYSFGNVSPGLFQAIVLQKLPPGPGPAENPGGRPSKPPGSEAVSRRADR